MTGLTSLIYTSFNFIDVDYRLFTFDFSQLQKLNPSLKTTFVHRAPPVHPPPLFVFRCDNSGSQTTLRGAGFLQLGQRFVFSLIFGPSSRCLASFFTATFLVDISKKTVFRKSAVPSGILLGESES